jgi:putative membrane protein
MEKDEKDLNKHSIFKAFLVEIKDRWFSSRKRILKTIGVFLIPFLYGFVCIAAFWNPLGNIGSAPIAIASLDQKQLLVEDFDAPNTNEDIALGIPVEYTTATV